MKCIYKYIECLEMVKARLLMKTLVDPIDVAVTDAKINILSIVIRDLENTKLIEEYSFWNEVG